MHLPQDQHFHPLMRLIFIIVVTVSVASSCLCSPETPTAVTIRVKNASRDPIYVNDTERALGVSVQRNVGGMLYSFDEHPCACRLCARSCRDSCFECADAGVSFIQRVEPGQDLSRTWDGVVQVSGFACGQACLAPENAPLDEVFTAHLCYTNEVTGFLALDAGRAEAPFPNVGVVCVDKEFKPSDAVVEIGPERGSDCTTSAQCKGTDELCFSGSCTSGCPANAYPSAPGLQVASVTNRGFFITMPSGERSVSSGTGLLTSAQYNGTTLNVQLSRRGAANEPLTGSVQVTMPTRDGPAFVINSQVTVTLIDASTSTNVSNRALLIRDAATGQLIFAADVAQLGRIVTAAELAPFELSDSEAPTGCRVDACGKALFSSVKVSARNASVDVATGDVATLQVGTSAYRFINAFNVKYAKTTCDFAELRPYALWLID